ncbi:MAG: peptidylprolyl isomerase [Sandarakinorhabdus sp.]|nr:peptidylprolyl isomerase [Sandarakinorhabdus sp.]
MILIALLAAAAALTPVSAPPTNWRPVAPENLLLLETARGTMAIELAPDFAPAHIAAIKALVAAGQFDGGNITRVQDNYVVQWAARQMTDKPAKPPKPLPAEYERPSKGLAITPLGSVDTYAPSGFWNGWPVAQDAKTGTAWLAHCYGSVGVGRENPPDTGDGSELYAVIGHGPRQLDRNIALVGRVIEGIGQYSSLPRGTGDIGFYKTPAEYTPITRVRLASNMADAPRFEVMDTASPGFAAYVQARANRTGFYVRPAGATDLCNVQVPVRRAK